MVTSPDSPPVPNNQEKIDKANESIHFVSSKSTRKIDRAVKKMQALKEDTPKYNNPQVIFLDPDNNEQDIQAQTKAIQREQQRVEKEQANLISITPAPQHTPQDELTKTHLSEKIASQKTDDTNNTTINNNTNDTQEPITQDATTNNTKDNELKLVNTLQTRTQNSVTSSTTSQEYCTPPLSPNSAISDINTEELEQLNETL